jgi:Bacterial Ig-like domain
MLKRVLHMRNILKYPAIPVLVLIINIGSQLIASDLSELKPYLRKTVSWKCTTQDKVVPMNIYFLGGNNGPDGSEVIVYVKNSAWDRIGQESDLSILSDYIKKKFIVITIDFGNDKLAVSPRFDKDLHEIFKAVYGYKTESLLKNLNLNPKEYRCFFLPEGYRVAMDLVYWEIDKHAVYGTLEYIMKSYNEDIVPKLPGLKPVTSPKEMVDRKGNPFDFSVKMDIVYPSQAKKKIPAIIFSAWLSARNPNGEPISYLPHFAGFTMRGYVYIVMGHCFNPCVQHYFHYSKFTLDQWNGFVCYSAAMRYINANAVQYSINTDHIGMAGHSKGEYAITRLSDPHHEGGKEISRFEGFPEGSPEPQPWPGYPSKISAGYQSMGMGLFEPQFITADYVPTIVACGEKERDEISKEAHPAFVKRLEELDVNYINLFMQGLGHEVPYGYDDRMGVDRYQLMSDFFDRYLKVEDKLPPVVLIISPRDNKVDVSPTAEISIDLAPVIDAQSIIREKGIMIISTKDNHAIDGNWKVAHGGTRYIFKPEQTLIKNEQYSIIVTKKVKDIRGIHLDQEKTVHFKVAPE